MEEINQGAIKIEEHKNSEYKYYLQYLRVLASIFVIVIHVTARFFKIDYNSLTWKFSAVLNCLSRTAVPIFFFITGILLLDESKNYTIKKIIKKAAKFFVITTIWVLIYKISDYYLYSAEINLIGYKYHLWFMFSYLMVIFLVPVLRLVCKKENKKIIEYLLLIFVIGYIFINLLSLVRQINSNHILVRVARQGYGFLESYKFNMIANPIILLITGWYIGNFDMSKYKRLAFGVLAINFLMVFVIVFLCVKAGSDYMFEFFSSYYNIFTYFSTIALFIVFKNLKTMNKKRRVVSFAARNSFSIYLSHILVIDILFKYCKKFLYKICFSKWLFLFMPGLIIAIYLGSFIISVVLMIIPRKYREYIC